jgi:hypothetical protein
MPKKATQKKLTLDREKLLRDLRDAQAAALKAVEGTKEDGGSSNFDAATLSFPGYARTVYAEVEAVAKEAGVLVHLRSSGTWKGTFILGVPSYGQGDRRTAQAEAMHKLLLQRGWATSGMYYQMD